MDLFSHMNAHAVNYKQNVDGTPGPIVNIKWDYFLHRTDANMRVAASTRGYVNMRKSLISQGSPNTLQIFVIFISLL